MRTTARTVLFCVLGLLALTHAVTITGVSDVRTRIDNRLSLRKVAPFKARNTDPSGVFTIDEARVGINVKSVKFNYVEQCVGRLPADVVTHIQTYCLVDNPSALNATLRARILTLANGSPLGRRLLSMPDFEQEVPKAVRMRTQRLEQARADVNAMGRRLLFLGTIVEDVRAMTAQARKVGTDCSAFSADQAGPDLFGSGVPLIDVTGVRAGMKADCLGNLFGNFSRWRNQLNDLTTGLEYALGNTSLWMNSTNQDILRLAQAHNLTVAGMLILSENVTNLALNLNATQTMLENFVANTDRRFNETQARLYEFQANTGVTLAGLNDSIRDVDHKYHNITTAIWTTLDNTIEEIVTMNAQLSARIEEMGENIQQQLDAEYAQRKNLGINRELNLMFFEEFADTLEEGRIPVVGDDFYIPDPASNDGGEAGRVMYARFHVNLLRNISCPSFGHCPQTEQWVIKIYGNRERLYYAGLRQFDLLRIIRLMRIPKCRRPVVRSRGGVYTNETDTDTQPYECLFWIEAERTYCTTPLNRRSTFKWRSAETGVSERGQTTIWRDSHCTDGINTETVIDNEPTQVFRDFTSYRRWFRDLVCAANLWVNLANGQRAEFQMAELVFRELFYVDQNTDMCGKDPFKPAATPPDLESIMYGIMSTEQLNTALVYQMKVADLRYSGARPSGIHYTDVPFLNMPPPEGITGNDALLYADARIDRCVYMEWVSMTPETVPVCIWTPLVGNSFQQITVEKEVNLTYAKQYDINVEVTGAATSVYSSFLDKSYVVVGKLGTQTGPTFTYSSQFYDVPRQQLDVLGPLSSLRNGAGYWLMPLENETLTQDVYNTIRRVRGVAPEPQYGGVSIQSYLRDRALDANGYPYCVLDNGAGNPINDTNPVRAASGNPNGDICDLMRYFKLSQITNFVPGSNAITFEPRQWEVEGLVSWENGLYENLITIANCSDTQLTRLGTAGWLLHMHNPSFVPLEQRVVVQSTSGACNDDQVYRIPANSPLDVEISACGNVTIEVYRRSNESGVWVTCVGYATDSVTQDIAFSIAQSNVQSSIVVKADANYERQMMLQRRLMAMLLDLYIGLSNFTEDAQAFQSDIRERRDSWTETDLPEEFRLTNFSAITEGQSDFYSKLRELTSKIARDAGSTVAAQATVRNFASQVTTLMAEVVTNTAARKVFENNINGVVALLAGIEFEGGEFGSAPRYIAPKQSWFMSPGYPDYSSWTAFGMSFTRNFQFPEFDLWNWIAGGTTSIGANALKTVTFGALDYTKDDYFDSPNLWDWLANLPLMLLRIIVWFGINIIVFGAVFLVLKNTCCAGCCSSLSCGGCLRRVVTCCGRNKGSKADIYLETRMRINKLAQEKKKAEQQKQKEFEERVRQEVERQMAKELDQEMETATADPESSQTLLKPALAPIGHLKRMGL
jgi:hypothetical protein